MQMATGNDKNRIIIGIIEKILEAENMNIGLAESLELLIQATHSLSGAIWIQDGKDGLYYPIFFWGQADMTNMSFRSGEYAEGMTAADGKSRLMNGQAGSEEKSIFEQVGTTVRSLICVPLNNLKETVGALSVANREDGRAYTDEELRICEQVAALMALTMEEKGYSLERARQKKQVLVEVRNLCKDFPSGEEKLRVLKNVNLKIYGGEFVVLLGESGCGKSTLVNIMGGMDNLTEGSLIIGGKDYSHPTDSELTEYRRNEVGFVFQNYNLMPNLTALENIQFLADLVPEPMDAAEALGKVGLADRADHYPSMLSGGQQQRVSIARAIVKKPKLIFADEPTAALDYDTSIEVLSVFQDIVRTQDATVIMITHNPEIAKMADRVIRIRSGSVSSIRINLQPAEAKELVW